MKVIAMTLRRAVERGAYIESHLAGLKLDYEIVDCIDYQSYTEEEYKAFYNEEAINNNHYITKGVIGCALSHVKILKNIVEQNLPYALVMEDDAALPNNIKQILAIIEQEIKEDEVIILSYHNHFKNDTALSNTGRKVIGKGLELVYPVEIKEIASTMAYVVTQAAARKLIDIMVPVYVSPDYWGVHYDKGGFNSFRCLYPMLVKPVPFRTTIDYAASKSLKSRIAGWVRKNKVPVLFQYLDKRSNKILDEKYTFHFTDEQPGWLKEG